jgi:hypothetical protein
VDHGGKAKILHGAPSFTLAMADVKKTSTTIHHGTAMTDI